MSEEALDNFQEWQNFWILQLQIVLNLYCTHFKIKQLLIMMKQEKVKKVKAHFHFNEDPHSRNITFCEKWGKERT